MFAKHRMNMRREQGRIGTRAHCLLTLLPCQGQVTQASPFGSSSMSPASGRHVRWLGRQWSCDTQKGCEDTHPSAAQRPCGSSGHLCRAASRQVSEKWQYCVQPRSVKGGSKAQSGKYLQSFFFSATLVQSFPASLCASLGLCCSQRQGGTV